MSDCKAVRLILRNTNSASSIRWPEYYSKTLKPTAVIASVRFAGVTREASK